jgi:hypothetical protein
MKSGVRSFEFVDYKIVDDQEIILQYLYSFDDGTETIFNEKIILPEKISSGVNKTALDRVLQLIHIMCGLSYWKLYCSPNIVFRKITLSKEEASFWNTIYTKGLGEFYFKNKIKMNDAVQFPHKDGIHKEPVLLQTRNRALMGIGGGKDSLVTFELLKKINYDVTVFILETQKGYTLIDNVVDEMNVNAIRIKRIIDPHLFTDSKALGAYNGHIPITAIYSAVGLLSSVVYDYRYIVMSNEKSANYGNVQYEGMEINHQWSKSVEFEKMFSNYVHTNISPDISYFSLLRPWSELRIVKEFVNYPQYFNLFSSCNTNFKISSDGDSGSSLWCGNCPKCAFVFAVMSAFISKNRLIEIFKKNLFADESLIPVYKELLGVKDFKPFECVGTPEEVQSSFYSAYLSNNYTNDAVMVMFTNEVLPGLKDPEKLKETAEKVGESPLLPDEFKKILSDTYEN